MNSLQQLARRRALPSFAPRVQSIRANRLWQRSFSATSAAFDAAKLDASKLTITKTTSPKELSPAKDLVFGRSFTGMDIRGSMLDRC
jgi:branched-chain amino acid aminotransferase